jgi:POT family proton-dependent oligopeptide transporter
MYAMAAPAAFLTQMVALYYLSVSLGTTIAGELATFYPRERVDVRRGARRDRHRVGVLLGIAQPRALRLMCGVRSPAANCAGAVM